MAVETVMERRPAPKARAAAPLSVARPIVGLLLIALVVTVLVAAWGAYDSYQRAWDDARDQVKDNTHILTEQAATLFTTHVASLRYVQNLADDAGWDGLGQNRRFHDRLHDLFEGSPELMGLWLLDTRGWLLASSGQWPVPKLNLSDRDYFKVHLTGWRGIYIGQQALGRVTGTPFLPISIRLTHPDGSFAGVAQLSLRPDYFISFYRSLFAGEPKAMMLLRDDGAVLVREPGGDSNAQGPSPLEKEFFPQFLTAPADHDGLFTLTSPVDGVRRLYGRRQLPNLPVTVVYGMDTSPILAQWRDRLLFGALLAVPILLATVVLARMALRRSHALAAAERGLRQANAVLEERVAERTRHLDRALADREILLRDTHHRVKNNLQVVSSLLQLQGALNPTLRPLLEDALQRIQAMGLLHEHLHQASKLDSVRLDLALRTLLREIDAIHQGLPGAEMALLADEGAQAPLRRVSVVVDAAPQEIAVASAVPLILIVNEVVSNAYKHAFPGGGCGEVRVRLCRDGDHGQLEIADDGVGMGVGVGVDSRGIDSGSVDTGGGVSEGGRRRRSLGMTLVEAFTRQLGGQGGYHPPPDAARGTCFTLRFPLPPET